MTDTTQVTDESAVLVPKASPTAGSGAECRKCGGAMRPGVAIEQTYSAGAPDFPGDTHGVTMSPAGPGQLIDCSKCEACGWSVTAGSGEKG